MLIFKVLQAVWSLALKQELIDQGIDEGFEQGINQKTYDIVLAMHDKGFDLAVIANITGLTITQVQALLQPAATNPPTR